MPPEMICYRYAVTTKVWLWNCVASKVIEYKLALMHWTKGWCENYTVV